MKVRDQPHPSSLGFLERPTVETRSNGLIVVRTRDFEMRCIEMPGAVVLTRYQGVTPIECFHERRKIMDACIARHGCVTFITDGAAWRGEGAGMREAWTGWLKRHRARVHAVHALGGSVVMRTGVPTIAAAIDGVIVAYDTRAQFERVIHHLFPLVDLSVVR